MRTFIALLLCTAACASTSPGTTSPPPPIVATDYNQHCSAASDCVLINEGDVCGCGGCGNSAINKSDQAKFNSDFDSRKKLCSGPPIACPAMCIYSETSCLAGTCGVCHTPNCGGTDAGTVDASHD